MNLVKPFFAALALASFASTASALTYHYQVTPINPIAFLSEGRTYNGTFSNLLPGLDFSQHEIVSAIFTLAFADEGDWTLEYALAKVDGKQVNLGGYKNANGASEVGGSHQWGYDYRSVTLGLDEFGTIETAGSLHFSVKADTNHSYYNSDFWLKKAKLSITTREKETPVSVPDTGASAALLLTALGGILAARKRIGR